MSQKVIIMKNLFYKKFLLCILVSMESLNASFSMKKKILPTLWSSLKVKSKHVLVRVDWNVPCKDGAILDGSRIKETSQTLGGLKDSGAKILVLSHYGRPTLAKNFKEKDDLWDLKFEKEFSLQPLIPQIETYLGLPLSYRRDPLASTQEIDSMKEGDIVLCENIRFYPGEERNSKELAEKFSKLADFFVNEAFSCSHRAHASIEAITHFLPSYAGFNLQREVDFLTKIFNNPRKPFWAVIGGSKVSTKIDLLLNLCQKVDGLIIGGAMANTFLKAQGISIGGSFYEKDHLETALNILKNSKAEIILPIDGRIAAKDVKGGALTSTFDFIGDDAAIFDIGSNSISLFTKKLSSAQTVIWNGPLGLYEEDQFAEGSLKIASFLADLTQNKNVTTLAGGGDTLAVLEKGNLQSKLSFCSTAGGAFLEYLEGKELPGLKALGI